MLISPAIRFYVYAAAAVMLFGGTYAYHRVELNKAHRTGYRAAQAEMAADVAKANAASASLEQRRRDQSQKAAVAHEEKRDALQRQIDALLRRPQPRIRVCSDGARGGALPRTAPTASRVDDQPAGSIDAVRVRELDPSAGILFAGTCERYRLQLAALQQWVTSTR